jgi:hypothetical protein
MARDNRYDGRADDHDRGERTMRASSVALIVVAAGAIGFGGWRYAQGDLTLSRAPAAVGEPSAPRRVLSVGDVSAARQSVEAAVRQAPDVVPFFDKMHDAFPADYAQTFDDFAVRFATSGSADSVDVYLSDAYRTLRQTRGVVAAKAGSEALARLFDTQAAVLKALGSIDPHLCVDFLYGGASKQYFAFSATHRPLVTSMAVADLDAIIDGNAQKIERPKPSDADFQALEQALAAKGVGKVEIDALIDGKTPDPPIEDGRMCAVAQIEDDVLKALPEDQRMRIYGLEVEMMARS